MCKRVLAKKKEIKRRTKKLVKHEYTIGPSGRNEVEDKQGKVFTLF